ncbi:MAG: GMC family oxidoreductase, partial [Pseudomonadota bacterium]
GEMRDVLMNVSTNPNVLPPLQGAEHGFKTSFSFTKPRSRGRVGLASADPLQGPLIDHNVFAEAADVRGALKALAISRDILSSREMGSFEGVELNQDLLGDDESRRRFLIAGATSFGHHVGTCRMGEDASAVVDQELNVRGVSGLSVVDASVIPEVPSSPTNALVVAMAELYAARAGC